MQRFYYVSYLYNNKNEEGYGCSFAITDMVGINVIRTMKDIEKDRGFAHVTITNFNEISKEQFEICLEEIEGID